MAQRLDTISTTVEWRVLQKGSRIFALLGKASPRGIVSFGREDIRRSWAVTAEYGCIRLERLTGEEEVTGLEVYLPTPFSYDYGISGISATELTRSVFGLLPSEMEELVKVMRRGSFPILGYSHEEQKCSVCSCIIPARWPHMVVSNVPHYGNVVCLESFVRILVASLPHGDVGTRFPNLHEVAKELLKLMGAQRNGFLYHKEMLSLIPVAVMAGK